MQRLIWNFQSENLTKKMPNIAKLRKKKGHFKTNNMQRLIWNFQSENSTKKMLNIAKLRKKKGVSKLAMCRS